MMIKRTMLAMLGLVLLVSVGVRAADPQEDEALLGTWTVVVVEYDGKALEEGKGDVYVFSADKYTPGKYTYNKYTYKHKGEKELEGYYTTDATKEPKWIDISTVMDPSEPSFGDINWSVGIYKLEGDRLTLCFEEGYNAQRPTAFNTASRSGLKLRLMVLQR